MSDHFEVYELNNVEYQLGVMPPTTALPVLAKLGNILGSGAGNIDIGDVMSLKDIEDTKSLPGGVVNALMSILQAVSGDDLLYIVRQCMPYIKIKIKADGGSQRRCNLESDFNGKTFDLLKVIAQFLKHNFKDFFLGSL